MREKFGPAMVGGIIAFIAFVFIFSGVFTPKATRGLHEGAVAGTVNGDPISLAEFNREYSRRMEFFKNLGGGKLTDAQLRAFHMKEGVFQELVNRKLMIQEAQRVGMVPSDEEIRTRIREIPAFQKEGKFDRAVYQQVLEANNFTPSGFERTVREDLSSQQWERYFRSRVRVSDEEVKQEYLLSNDKRTIKYVLLSNETGRKGVQVDPADVDKFLKDTAKVNLAKSQYEGKKETEYKGKSFDDVKTQIARDLLASEKIDQVQKVNENLASQLLNVLSDEKKANALLKNYGTTVKSTNSVTRSSPYIAGVGEVRPLIVDAFSDKLSQPKKYTVPAGVIVAVVTSAEKPDLSKFETEKEKLMSQILYRKERELFAEWQKKLSLQAKVERNKSVVNDGDTEEN
jgi:parvulin-like peptidyl-prolyl isomerase